MGYIEINSIWKCACMCDVTRKARHETSVVINQKNASFFFFGFVLFFWVTLCLIRADHMNHSRQKRAHGLLVLLSVSDFLNGSDSFMDRSLFIHLFIHQQTVSPNDVLN